jgi:hypothetical protein
MVAFLNMKMKIQKTIIVVSNFVNNSGMQNEKLNKETGRKLTKVFNWIKPTRFNKSRCTD